jgi:hypothetical protein
MGTKRTGRHAERNTDRQTKRQTYKYKEGDNRTIKVGKT